MASNATGKSIFGFIVFPRGFSTYAKLHTTRVKAGTFKRLRDNREPKMDRYDRVLTIVQRVLEVYWLVWVITGNTRCEGMPGVQNMRWVAGT